MKTYSILYAEDVPHYATHEIRAKSTPQAIAKAIALDTTGLYFTDPDWDGTVCRRIVHIEDERSRIVAENISLDRYFLRNGGAPDRALCDAAPAMLEALQNLIARADHLISAIDSTTGQFEAEVSRLSNATSAAEKIILNLKPGETS